MRRACETVFLPATWSLLTDIIVKNFTVENSL